MARPQSLAGVAMKIFMELEEVLPVWIADKTRLQPKNRPAAAGVREKQAHQPPGQLARHLRQRPLLAATGGKFDGEAVAIKTVITLQGLDQQVIEGKPNRPAPG